MTEAKNVEQFDDELPPLEGQDTTVDTTPNTSSSNSQYSANMRKRISKAEKKVKKAMQKLNLNEVPGVSRVSIRQARLLFTIHDPEVYEISNDSYLVFGEAKVDSLQKRPQMDELLKNVMGQVEAQKQSSAPAPAADEDIEVDESELDANDIEVVMSQAGVSRKAAAKALLDNDKDLVQTILSLTPNA